MEYAKLVERLRDIQESLQLMAHWTGDSYLKYDRLMAEHKDIEAILSEMERVNP